ncbi:putative serine incorporator [Trypanosoma rangeli]|uniref:Putative serine incorporator n=1 Tax=Trypanosoma rangeli TaxID=5698 RepID=A0A3R7M259_TRYRA|nr:putative serine incorporator [Trypanosoma rangeli]RNF07685.1 putative serine incorporator [Trypanosoma rangeli]|eukprot:RNF07685.1 putative serine incorporator [Trypanosoma rangeli]
MPEDGEKMTATSNNSGIFTPGVMLRVQYACYLLVGLIATMLLRSSLAGVFSHVPILQKGCNFATSASSDLCTGEVLVYRVSFALAVFFFLHLLSVSDLTCCISSEARAEFQRRFFYAKTILVVGLLAATFWIPNHFFGVYAYACLFASAFFLLLNVVFLVDFSYQWSEDWGRRSEVAPKWMWYLLGLAVLTYLGGVGVNIAAFVMYVPHSDCNFNAFAITSVLVGALFFTVLSIWVPHGSIVPSGIVFLYTSCVMFATLRTGTDAQCNRLAVPEGQTGSVTQMILASVVSSFALGYSAVSSGGNSSALGIGRNEEGEEEDPDEIGHLSQYIFFYATMMLGSMYLAMLATGWHVSGMGKDTLLGSINIAFWVRSATVWAAALLYIWSLLAPYFCCRDRDFGYDVDDW